MNTAIALSAAMAWVDAALVSRQGVALHPLVAVPPRLRELLKACISEALTTAPEAWVRVAMLFRALEGAHRRGCDRCRTGRCPQAAQLVALEAECLENDRGKRLTSDGVVFVIKRSEVLARALERLLAIEELLDGMEEVDGERIDPEERAYFAATWFFDQAALADCQRFLKLAREAKTSRMKH